MRIFFDCEFLDDGCEIHLLSIGLVREDGKEYYAEIEEAPWDEAAQVTWLAENVIATLTGPKKPRKQVAHEIEEFVGTYPEFWAYFAAWDWVSLVRLCSATGLLLDTPPSWPHYCNDIKQLHVSLGRPPLPSQTSTKHNALDDAKWNKLSYEVLTQQTL